MCVPYSFLVTKDGDIISKENVEHHSDLCTQFGLNYDEVLKPEFHIWDKQLTDVAERVHHVDNRDRIFYKDGDITTDGLIKDFWLKDKYYKRINDHVKDRFGNWKRGLEFIEQNWNICKRYVPKLVSKPITFEMSPKLLEKTIENIEKDFDTKSCITVRPYVPSTGGSIYGIEYRYDDNTVFKCELAIGFEELLNSSELESHVRNRLKAESKLLIAKQAITDKYITVDIFKDHWFKEENRVECWRN